MFLIQSNSETIKYFCFVCLDRLWMGTLPLIQGTHVSVQTVDAFRDHPHFSDLPKVHILKG